MSCSLEYVGRVTAGSPSPSPDGSADDPGEDVAPAEPSASPGAAEPGEAEADASARFDCSAARDSRAACCAAWAALRDSSAWAMSCSSWVCAGECTTAATAAAGTATSPSAVAAAASRPIDPAPPASARRMDAPQRPKAPVNPSWRMGSSMSRVLRSASRAVSSRIAPAATGSAHPGASTGTITRMITSSGQCHRYAA